MDSADAAAAPFVGGWASIRAYFTPATLFLVVNLVIGTIALTSRATQHRRRRREHEHYHYHDDGHGHYHLQEQEQQHHHQPAYGDHYYPPPHQQQQQPLYATPPEPAPLARTSSIVDRLRSFDFGLYRFRSGDFPPEYGAAAAAVPTHAHDAFTPVEEETMPAAEQAHYARTRSEPAPATREERMRPPASRAKKPGSEVRKAQVARSPPARVVEAVAGEDDAVDARAEEEFAASFGREREKSPLQEEYNYQEEYVPPVRPRAPTAAPLARTSSIMDRLRSLGGYLAPEQPAAASIPAAAAEKKQAHAQAHYDRSRSEPAEKQQEAKPRMAKSTSETKKAAAPSRAEAALAGESYVPPPGPLARAPSVLERLRSFGLSRFRSGDLGADLPAAAAAATPAAADEKRQPAAAAQYGRSRSEPAREQGKKEPRMRKSSSSVAEEEEEPAAEADHGVDARADDFINKFRQQLQLQRLNSLLNYKEMLGGGGKQ
ncbi:unnamed protein product [Urochloa decumbens]|uniref:DUF4408 domain-containing protein n=1 Tax=Urochloa decumbens TaxID=240449 RepID=A0ABC8WFW1_9POAL